MNKKHFSTHRIICWRLTRKCNRECEFCLSNSTPNISHPKNNIIHDVSRLANLGVEKLSYTGGEPLLLPSIHTLVLEAKKYCIKQIITTNGDVLMQKEFGWLNEFEYIRLSFYGSKIVHNSLMGKEHYERLLVVANKLSKKRTIVCANYMLTNQSINFLEDFLHEAIRASIDKIVILTFIPIGTNEIDSKYKFDFSVDTIEKIRSKIAQLAHNFKAGIKLNNYLEKNFYIVLNDIGQFTLPRSGGESDFIMGGLYDEVLSVPNGLRLPSSDALEYIWNHRRDTDAIYSVI